MLNDFKDEREKYIHNSIMIQWELDFGSIHKDYTMDAYTVSGFVRNAIANIREQKEP